MEKINVIQIKDHITQILRERIFSGKISDGEKLTQKQIAESLGVSRMPVREAFQMLEEEGYLERLANRHVIVNGISKEGIINNFRILRSIEEEIALMIIENNLDITSLKVSLKEYKEASLIEANEDLVKRQTNFHLQLSIIQGDKYIEKLHKGIINGYFVYALSNIDYNIDLSIKSLEKILITIENKDKKDIKIKIKEYYLNILQSLNEEFDYE